MAARAYLVVQVRMHRAGTVSFRNTPHFTRHTSHFTLHTSHVTRHTLHSLADYVIRSPYLEGVRRHNVLQVTCDS